jgi:hypothetical protein
LMRSAGSSALDSEALMMLMLARGGGAAGSNDTLGLMMALQGSDLFVKGEKTKGGKTKGGHSEE